MSEHFDEHAEPAHACDGDVGRTDAEHEGAPAGEQTGHPDVDAVVASLADLEGRPVSEHVAVFEAAHDRLRSALADAGNQPSGS